MSPTAARHSQRFEPIIATQSAYSRRKKNPPATRHFRRSPDDDKRVAGDRHRRREREPNDERPSTWPRQLTNGRCRAVDAATIHVTAVGLVAESTLWRRLARVTWSRCDLHLRRRTEFCTIHREIENQLMMTNFVRHMLLLILLNCRAW